MKKSAIFKFIDKGKNRHLLLIPGWATSYRIFSLRDLGFNYLLPLSFSPSTFSAELLKALSENNLDKISILGWSMGGFLAGEFAANHPEMVEELILVSVRKKYRSEEIEGVKNSLTRNKEGYLYKFFGQSITSRECRDHFRTNYFSQFCDEFDTGQLIDGLEYLSRTELKPEMLSKIKKIKFIHGNNDRIAPLSETLAIHNSLENSELILLKGAGHLPLLRKDFQEALDV